MTCPGRQTHSIENEWLDNHNACHNTVIWQIVLSWEIISLEWNAVGLIGCSIPAHSGCGVRWPPHTGAAGPRANHWASLQPLWAPFGSGLTTSNATHMNTLWASGVVCNPDTSPLKRKSSGYLLSCCACSLGGTAVVIAISAKKIIFCLATFNNIVRPVGVF